MDLINDKSYLTFENITGEYEYHLRMKYTGKFNLNFLLKNKEASAQTSNFDGDFTASFTH